MQIETSPTEKPYDKSEGVAQHFAPGVLAALLC